MGQASESPRPIPTPQASHSPKKSHRSYNKSVDISAVSGSSLGEHVPVFNPSSTTHPPKAQHTAPRGASSTERMASSSSSVGQGSIDSAQIPGEAHLVNGRSEGGDQQAPPHTSLPRVDATEHGESSVSRQELFIVVH